MPRIAIAAAAFACAALIVSSAAAAEVGVTSGSILLGQAAVMTGPASALGQGMRAGLEAAFAEVNRRGGVHGRQLKLVSRDDGYEPERSIAETKKLIDEDKVFALVGPVGTPTAAATQPIATAANIPYVGAFTGAGFLRNPKLANVINLRASYGAEAEAWIKHLTQDLGLSKIAIFYQDDAFGRAGLDAVNAAMKKRHLALVAEGTYERNTVAIKTALITIQDAEPDAVVMVGAYKPSAEFIKLARKLDFNPVFLNISFVGAAALARELGPDGKGVVVSQVVPFPWDKHLKVVAEYRAALKASDPKAEPDFVSLEGYLVGRLVEAGLEKAGSDPTRASFLAAIRGAPKIDLDGLTLTFGPEKNEALDQVFLTVMQGDGTFSAVDRLSPPAMAARAENP